MSVRVWDLAEHRMKNVRKLKKAARSVTYSPDGRALAVGFKDGEEVKLERKLCHEGFIGSVNCHFSGNAPAIRLPRPPPPPHTHTHKKG